MLRAFVDKEIVPVAREWEQTGRYPTEIVDDDGGAGPVRARPSPRSTAASALDTVSFALVFEEIARGWMGIAGILGSHSLACWMIARHGTDEQKQRYLPDLATGARRTGIALTEPDAGTDLQGIRTTARRDGDDYVDQRHARRGSPTPATPTRCPCWCKTDPSATPAHRGMSVLLVEAGTPGLRGHRATCRSSATRAPSPARSCSTTCRVPVDAPARRRRGPRHAAGAVGAGDGPDQHRRPRASASPSAPTTRRCAYAERAPRVRPADRRVPGDPAQARRHGDRGPGGPADGLLGGVPRPTRGAPRRHCEAGMAKMFASEVGAAGAAGGDADPRRLRLLDGVRGRAPLPRRAR